MNPRVSRSSALASKATGLPHRQDRRPPGRRLPARRDPQRHHQGDAGVLRADHRLRRHQGAALGLREAARGRRSPRAPACSRWARSWPSAAPSASRCRRRCARSSRAGPGSTPTRPRPRSTSSPTDELLERIAVATPERIFELEAALRRGVGGRRGGRPGPASTPGSSASSTRIVGRARSASPRRRRSGRPTSAGPSGSGSPTRSWPTCAARPTADVRAARLAHGVRATFKTVDTCAAEFEAFTPYHYATYEEEDEVRPSDRARVDHPRLGPEPHRPGHRVRLLLRARLHDAARRRLRDGDGQLQPRDGLDRLRHLGPPLLRAADRRGRGQRARRRAGGGRDGGGRHRVARRADAAEAGRLAPARAGARDEPGLHRPGRGPRALERAVPRARHPAAARRARRPRRPRRWPSPGRSATRCCCARATCWAAGPWRSSTTTTGCAASCSR